MVAPGIGSPEVWFSTIPAILPVVPAIRSKGNPIKAAMTETDIVFFLELLKVDPPFNRFWSRQIESIIYLNRHFTLQALIQPL
jgi:hypothetical protein